MSESTTRLFVAIDPPEKVRERIAPVCRELDEARWVRSDQLHVTMRFLGSVATALIPKIAGSLSTVTAPSFSSTAQGFGVFPSFRSPRVLWIGLSPVGPLERLHGAIDSNVARTGTVGADEKRFSPHLTLARLNGTRPAAVRAWMESREDFSAGPWRIDAFFLYASTLTPDGAIHRRLETYRLAAARSNP
jgi:2'-5' RNA ligase